MVYSVEGIFATETTYCIFLNKNNVFIKEIIVILCILKQR